MLLLKNIFLYIPHNKKKAAYSADTGKPTHSNNSPIITRMGRKVKRYIWIKLKDLFSDMKWRKQRAIDILR